MSKADILAKLVSAGAVLADGTITASELGLATVATSGSYTDLSGKQTLFSGSYTDLTNKPTTLAGYGITDAQPLDGDLTSIAALAGTSGLLKKTAANTWTLDTNTYLTGYTETDTLATVTARGATSSAQITLSGAGDNTTTYSSLRFAGYNQGGGVGYHGFFEVQNTYGSVINGKKFFRLDGSGSLQIINSAYTTNIFNLTDAGVLTVPQISAGGSVGTNGQVLTSTGTGLTWTSAGAGTVTSVSGTGTVSGLTLTV
jgi:hypothetical protein